jgi:hypothetical protein
MKTESVSVTIPNIPEYLDAAARFLGELAAHERALDELPDFSLPMAANPFNGVPAAPVAPVPLDTKGVVTMTVYQTQEDQAAAAPALQPLACPPPPPVEPGPYAELDSAGKPWDATIHSSSRARVKDGTWKMKRGLGGDVPPPPAPTAPVAPKREFKDLLMEAVTKHGPAGYARLNEIAIGLGVASFGHIGTKPELVDRAWEILHGNG